MPEFDLWGGICALDGLNSREYCLDYRVCHLGMYRCSILFRSKDVDGK